MKKSEIHFNVLLDEESVPEKIEWQATDKPNPDEIEETKSLSISLWDHNQKNTLRIDIWSKDMPVDEMKKFYIDCVGGIAQSALSATGDEYMSNELKAVCERLAQHVQKENEQQ
jgi:gliding motility-associated protein GldC